MFDNIAAFDIGTSSIKVVLVKTGIKDFQLKTLLFENIDHSIEDSKSAVIDAVTKIAQEEDLSGYKIITNLPMEKEIIRNITFPFSDVEKIAEAIPYEAEENIPFKLEDLILDFLPLKRGKAEEGRILLAAAHKETVYDQIYLLNEHNLGPIHMGMESIALFECYKFFNKIEDENIIQVDIGNNKTIINMIENNQLLFTRSISIGVNLVHDVIMKSLNVTYNEAVRIFENLNIDLTSYENNVQREHYKSLGITKSNLKKIFTVTTEIVTELIEQTVLTTKALFLDYGNVDFNRVLISGGGSNIAGLGTMLSKELAIPVVATPFIDEYEEQRIRSQYPIAFGTALSFIKSRRSSINFLKGEFVPDIAASARKIYNLAAAFGILALLMIIINFAVSFILASQANTRHSEILQEKFRRYFHTKRISEDPIADARKLLNKEKRKLGDITHLIPETDSALDILYDITSCFPQDTDFELRNFVFNQRVMRIDGLIGSSKSIDDFKDSLVKSRKFESVNMSIRGSVKNQIRFTMSIKQKVSKQGKEKRKRK